MANLKDSLETQEKILGFLSEDHVKTVVLSGEAGVGKTWMAKKISNYASHNGSCYGPIWVVREYNNEGKSLVEYIAFQLSVFPSDDEWEEDDNTEMKPQEQEKNLQNLKRRIQEKLKLMKTAKLDQMKTSKPEEEKTVKVDQKDAPGDGNGPYILVVLDDFDNRHYCSIYSDLTDLLHEHHFKILITGSGSNICIGNEGNDFTIVPDHIYEMKFLSNDDSLCLLNYSATADVRLATGFERLSATIGKGSQGRPGVIIMIAEAMNRVKDSELDNAVEEMASIIESADNAKLWQHVYQMLPSTLSKCCWHCRYLFVHHNRIHYNELIAHWLLEGYFGYHDHYETAYEEAHHTLMELKVRGFLKEKEDSYITMESDALRVNDHRRDGLSGSAHVGVASVLGDHRWAGLGRVIQTDGMIKTSRVKTGSKKRDEMSTLFIDGARFRREVPETFLQHKNQLKVLVIINPMFEKVPSQLAELKELQVLVLRGCHILKSVDEIHKLTNLLVLEISGARMVKQIRDDIFEHMKDLRSLNLSEVGIRWLPASLLNRRELRWLILRKCPNLNKLCDTSLLKKKEAASESVLLLAKLEVLDFSGSDSFWSIQVKNLSPLEKLQILNLSKTRIGRLPFFHNLGELTRLLLGDCPSLARLPTLKPLTKLKILDLSKTTCLKEVQDDPQETKTDFRVLDLTGSAVNKLPLNISSLSHLLLSSCVHLCKLPSTQGLPGLEELNLCDASALEEFEDSSFEHLNSLRRLILSNTKIKALPSLSQPSELRLLLLKNCKFLTKLQNLPSLQKLEVLDLSGCSELVITSNDSFQGMSCLKTINLSETKIESLPRDCFPVSLCRLIIRNCPHWNNLPSLEALKNLEVLDLCGGKSLSNIKLEFLHHMNKLRILNLSEIKFEELPSLSHLTNLRELSLRGCSCKVSKLDALKELELLDLSGTTVESLPPLETFSKLQQLLLGDCADLKKLENLTFLTNLEVLDLSGTEIEEFPYEISDLSTLRKLNLQDMKHMKEIDWKKIKYIPEEFNLGGCGSLSSEIAESSKGPSIMICGTRFFQFVEENPMLWDTCFQKFHFSVWLPKNSDGRIYDLGDMGLLRDIESQGRIPHHKEPGRYLEIHGSYSKFNLPEHVLEHADHISLVDDSSLKKLSELVKENLRSIKSCWLEKCTDICSIVDGEGDARASGKLDSLYLCNLSSLSCVCDDSVQSEVFGRLKHLYIDCCPMLTNIFSFSKLPKKLETLEINFCEKMERLFSRDMSVECNLQTSDLLQLPELPLRVLKVRHCPKLENLEKVLGEAKNLEILQIHFYEKMERLFNPDMPVECNLQTLDLMQLPKLKGIGVMMVHLRVLKVRQCPKLENLEEVVGEAKNLEILQIHFYEKMDRLFNPDMPVECNLQTLDLMQLPKLKGIGVKMVHLRVLKVRQCPKLENLEEVVGEAKNLEILQIQFCEKMERLFNPDTPVECNLQTLDLMQLPKLKGIGVKMVHLRVLKVIQCPKLENLDEVVGEAKNLEILQIQFCEKMERLFNPDTPVECNLQTLDLMQLPKLKGVGVMMVHLRVLKVRQCPKLENLEEVVGEAKNLEILQIHFYEKMERLFNPDMPVECNLQTLDLLELPKLERIGARMVSLQVLKVRRCPKLENLEEVLGEAENLEILHISYAAKLKTICSREVKRGTFKNLKQLKIESCPLLKEVSPSSELPPKLEILEINSCKSLETIFRGRSAGSSLERLRLWNLPSLRNSVFEVAPQCHADSNCPNVRLSPSENMFQPTCFARLLSSPGNP